MSNTRIVPPAPKPWPDACDGAELLNEISAMYGRHLVLPEWVRNMSAVWDLATHCQLKARHFPRLFAWSPEGGCGKTTYLELKESVTYRPVLMDKATPALLMRLINKEGPGNLTVLLDEADNYVDGNFVNLLNSGYSQGKRFLLNVPLQANGDWEPKAYDVYCALSFCRVANLQGGSEAKFKTAVTRMIEWHMGRTTATERQGIVPFNKDVHRYYHLGEKCARWAANNGAALQSALGLTDQEPGMPPHDSARFQDNWRILFAVAHVVGGDWPEKIRHAYSVCSNAILKSTDFNTELGKAICRALSRCPQHHAKGELWIKSVDLCGALLIRPGEVSMRHT